MSCHVPDDDNDAVLFEKIKSGNYDADDPIWENISAEAKDVVAKLLTVRHSAAPWDSTSSCFSWPCTRSCTQACLLCVQLFCTVDGTHHCLDVRSVGTWAAPD